MSKPQCSVWHHIFCWLAILMLCLGHGLLAVFLVLLADIPLGGHSTPAGHPPRGGPRRR